MNTQENNKMIAEFMRWDIKSLTTIPPNLHLSNLQLDNGDIMELKFHESWDWLMPVVDKMNTTELWDEYDISYLATYLVSVDINATYNAVVEFINEYNKNESID